MRVLVIIPAYNEETSIKNTVMALKEKAPFCDFLVINDGSTDSTEKICRENGLNYVSLINNLGIGGAVQTGYKYAYENDYDCAVQMDGDGQHDPAYISKMLSEIENGFDIIIGSRFLEKEGFQSTKFRRAGITLFRKIIKFLCRKDITDSTSGFRCVNRKLIAEFARSYPTDYPEPESIVRAFRIGMKAKEIPVIMSDRTGGKTSITLYKSFYYMIKVTMAIVFARFSSLDSTG